MIVGVDAGALSISDERLRVGVWRVTYHLLEKLGNIDTQNEYRLYTFLPIDKEVMKVFGPRMKNTVVRPTVGWSKIQLPIELRRHPVDVFLGLSQMVPYTDARCIGWIYDVGFLQYPEAYSGSLQRLENQTKQLIARSQKIVTISEASKEDIIKRYKTHKNKIFVAYPGVDRRFTATGTKHNEENPYVLFVGALKRGKNVPFALQVFKKFLEQSEKIYDFVLVGGDYWSDPEIKETMVKLGLKDRVKITGFIPDSELPSYYRGAEMLLVTSLWEGFCLPSVEAMASGCPVIATSHGSLPEVVGKAGIIVAEENSASFCESMMRLAGSTSLRNKLITAGLVRAKQFTWGKFARQVLDIIEGAVV